LLAGYGWSSGETTEQEAKKGKSQCHDYGYFPFGFGY